MTARLDRLSSVEVATRAGHSLVVVPLGSTEQHGAHLPLGTDTMVAAHLAELLASRRADVLVAPALAYGASGEHAGFAGTLSIAQRGVHTAVVELARSADAFAGVLLISGHGGNAEPLAGAVAVLRAEGRQVRSWSPSATVAHAAGLAADLHAGRAETSIVAAIEPDAVRWSRSVVGDTRPLPEVAGLLRSAGVAAVSPNGVLGDPSGASAEEGRRLLGAYLADLLASVEGWPGRRAGSR